jgi:myosin protein heavy chain
MIADLCVAIPQEADSAKKELETLKEQIMVLREESASSDGIIKGAIADKEEVVCQLSKVMKVCEELQKERKSLAQQLLDMQDQLMSQEQKISEDRGHLQTAEAARKSAEDQLADLSVAHQQLLKQTSDCDDAPRLLSKVQRESDEANATIQNLVAKLEDVTQELIAVTEERDKISDEHERLRREVRDKQMSSASLEDDYHHLREKVQELSEKQRFELEQAQQQHNANVAKLLSQHKYDLEQVREDLAARQQQLLEQKRQNEMLQDKLSASRIVEQQQQVHDIFVLLCFDAALLHC